jgi:universal stress protein E
MNKILLVAGDKPETDAAIARLVELADDSTAVELLTIVHEPNLDGYLGNSEIYAPLRQRLIDEQSEKAGAYVRALEDRGIEVVPKAVWDWPRGDAIRREAFEYGADCIILSFGLGRDRHFGSRDWRFLAECPVPILVVNGGADRPYRKVVAAVDPVHSHAKPADLDRAIVATAAVASERAEASLSLVHCYVPLSRYGSRSEDRDSVPLNDAEQALEQSRQAALNQLAAEAGLDPQATRLIEGDPFKDLERLVAEDDVDLIVMGALSRGKLADFVIGSTAERLLHRAGCDILLVKPTIASS